MSTLSIRTVRDSADIELSVSGILPTGVDRLAEIILQPKAFRDSPKFAKLNALFYSFEDGLQGILYWEHEDEDEMMLPLAGRGVLDLERFGGIENPKRPGHTGNVVLVAERSSPGKKHFVLGLEFSKQRS